MIMRPGCAGFQRELQPPVGGKQYALQGGPYLAKGGGARGWGQGGSGNWLGSVGFAWEQMRRRAQGFASAQLPPYERNGVQSSASSRPVGLLVGLAIVKLRKSLF